MSYKRKANAYDCGLIKFLLGVLGRIFIIAEIVVAAAVPTVKAGEQRKRFITIAGKRIERLRGAVAAETYKRNEALVAAGIPDFYFA